MIRLVVPFGFYGAGNIGDEATLNGFARLLSVSGSATKASIGSRNPAHNARIEPMFRYFKASGRDPRRWWAKYWATAHGFVGGTPIMDVLGRWPLSEVAPIVRATDRWKVPVAFIGIGVETLRQDESRELVTREIAPRVRHWSVRTARGRERLIEYGVPPERVSVTADMAWLIEPQTEAYGLNRLQNWQIDPSRRLIGVNLVNENGIFDQHPEMTAALAAALDTLVDQLDAQVIFLSNEVRDGAEFDRAPALQVTARMRRADRTFIAPLEYLAPRQMMSIVSRCCLTISMRYHFCLFSALQGVPFIAIQRSDKVADLCWDLKWEAKVTPPKFDAEEIIGHAMRVTKSPADQKFYWQNVDAEMKNRALENIVAVNALQDPLTTGDRPAFDTVSASDPSRPLR